MTLIAIESSCDETSVAVVRDGTVLSNQVATQIQMHAEYGGVVPELASREHLKNLPHVAAEALRQAGVKVGDLDAVAATRGPGLPSALLIGYNAAQALAFVLEKPFIGVNHHEAHLYSPWIGGDPVRADWEGFVPSVSLIVSGGHTMLVHVEGILRHRLLGSTIDDAAGECFDKIAKLMGLPYPGGPKLDQLAERGNPAAYEFPAPLIHDPSHDFSFSGLKTSVRYFLRDRPGLLDDTGALCDVCASVRAAIVRVLVTKTMRAARQLKVSCVTASGGVTCNIALRRQLAAACQKEGLQLRLAVPSLCTDNAGMIAVLAEYKLNSRAGSETWLDEDILPGWHLG
ncbi:MAG: tRNA (adenosine(37)-N6)-threonylcarbamoyltransferase complex transferase subunit TsaD [Verrucomicrobia bacterium]|nr:tRNA (adenosine(37)-N6)-threonylcarbamoyltransferase complex transferase subunit TsaD [Verrucomicrobiota bacterium]